MRTLESYETHLRDKVDQCCKSWLVLIRDTLLGPELIVTPYRCQSNYCPTCRSYNLHSIRAALIRTMRGERWRLVTLTYPPNAGTTEQLLVDSYSRFKRLANRLRKRTRGLKYIRTLEVHASGAIHHHCVFNRYLPQAYLQQAWRELGGGIVDITAAGRCHICKLKPPCKHIPHPRTPSYKQAARYLTEEIEKHIQDPHRLGPLLWIHRVRTITVSRSLKLQPPKQGIRYVGKYDHLEDAMSWRDYLEALEDFNDRPSTGIASTSSGFLIGKGYSDKQTVITV